VTNRLYLIVRRAIVHIAAPGLKPIPMPSKPTYNPSKDVTIIIPTIDPQTAFKDTLLTFAINNPLEILVVTDVSSFAAVEALVTEVVNSRVVTPDMRHFSTVKILTVCKASKRSQMALGVRHAQGSVIVLLMTMCSGRQLYFDLSWHVSKTNMLEVPGFSTKPTSPLVSIKTCGSFWQLIGLKNV
jgi:hypothetical protein